MISSTDVNKLGKKVFFLAIFFLPLNLYRWRIGDLPSFSLFEVFIIASLLITVFRVRIGRIAVFLIIMIMLFTVELFVFIIYNGSLISQTFNWLKIGLLWIITSIAVNQYIRNFKDLEVLFKTISYSSIWLFYGTILHVFELISKNFWHSVPFGDILQTSLPKSEATLIYSSRVTIFGGIRRFSFPISFSASGAGVSASLIFLITVGTFLYYSKIKVNTHFFMYFFIIIDAIYVLLTLSRTAYIMSFIGLIILFSLHHRFEKKVPKRILKILTAFILIIVGLLLMFKFIEYITKLDIPEIIMNRLFRSYYSKLSTEGHLETRLYAIKLFAKHPVFGNGLGGYKLYRTREFHEFAGGQHPHSNYFLVLAEGGIVGLTMYLVLLFLPLRFLWKGITVFCKLYNKSIPLIILLIVAQITLYVGIFFYSYFGPLMPIIISCSWIFSTRFRSMFVKRFNK